MIANAQVCGHNTPNYFFVSRLFSQTNKSHTKREQNTMLGTQNVRHGGIFKHLVSLTKCWKKEIVINLIINYRINTATFYVEFTWLLKSQRIQKCIYLFLFVLYCCIFFLYDINMVHCCNLQCLLMPEKWE